MQGILKLGIGVQLQGPHAANAAPSNYIIHQLIPYARSPLILAHSHLVEFHDTFLPRGKRKCGHNVTINRPNVNLPPSSKIIS